MVTLGLWTKDSAAVSGDNATYEGWVRVRKDNNGNYHYYVGIKNGEYYIESAEENEIESKIKQGNENICDCDLTHECDADDQNSGD